MRLVVPVLCLFLLISATSFLRADEAEAQRQAARENWQALDAGEPATLETAHLILLASASHEKKLKELGTLLEKQYEQARKALGLEKEEPLPGKVAVYLLPEREKFTSLVRRLEKRRVESEDAGSHFIDGDRPHVIAGPPRAKGDPTVEGQAAEQLAQALLAKKAGAKTPLPGWLLNGFGRATSHRVAPRDRQVIEDRRRAATLVRARSARDVWSGAVETPEEAVALQASLAGYLAYEGGASKFAAFLDGFKPGENEEKRTTEQALESADIRYDNLNARWRAWAASQR